MGADERELEELLRIKRRRLNELNKQIARLGYSAPPHLVTERDDLKAEIEKEKPVLEPIIKGELSDETMAILRAYGVPAAVSNAIMLVEQGLGDFKKEFREYRDQRNRDVQIDHTERATRQMQVDNAFRDLSIKVDRIGWRQWLTIITVAIIVTYLITRGLS